MRFAHVQSSGKSSDDARSKLRLCEQPQEVVPRNHSDRLSVLDYRQVVRPRPNHKFRHVGQVRIGSNRFEVQLHRVANRRVAGFMNDLFDILEVAQFTAQDTQHRLAEIRQRRLDRAGISIRTTIR